MNPTAPREGLHREDGEVRNQTVPAPLRDEHLGAALHPPLLQRGDGCKAPTEAVALLWNSASLHLDEVEMIPAAGNQVDLAVAIAKSLAQNKMSSPAQKARSEAFAELPEGCSVQVFRVHSG